MSLTVQTSLSADVTSLSVEGFFLFGGFARCKFAGASFVSTVSETTAALALNWVAGATINAAGAENYVAVVKNVSALAKNYAEGAENTAQLASKWVAGATLNTALALNWVAGATINAEGAENYVAVVKNVSALAKDYIAGEAKFDYLYIGVSTASETTGALAPKWVAGATVDAKGEAK